MYVISIQIRENQFYLTNARKYLLMLTRDINKAKVWTKKPTSTISELRTRNRMFDKTSQSYVFDIHDNQEPITIQPKKVTIYVSM